MLALHLGDGRMQFVRPDLVPARNAQGRARSERVHVPDGKCFRIGLQNRQHHALGADGRVGPQRRCDRPECFRLPDRSVRGPARSRLRDGCGRRRIGLGLRRRLRATGRARGGGSGRRREVQLVPSHGATARPVHVDEERKRRLDDRFGRPHVDVAAALALRDHRELEKAEMLQPRHPGELELSRGTERDVQCFEIAASGIPNGDPRIQGFVQRGTGFDGAELQRGRERGSERREAGHARGEPAHDLHPRRHGTPVRDTGVPEPPSGCGRIAHVPHTCRACGRAVHVRDASPHFSPSCERRAWRWSSFRLRSKRLPEQIRARSRDLGRNAGWRPCRLKCSHSPAPRRSGRC